MYTRCPSCSSTFRVTAAILQMAAGEVRCGACGAVFNALETLVDDWSGADPEPAGTPQLSHPAGQAPDPSPPAAEPAETALEFNVPENEWQRFFLSPQEPAPPRAEPALGDDFDALVEAPPPAPEAATPIAAIEPPRPVRSLEEETADTDTWQGFLRDVEPAPQPELEPEVVDDEPLFVLGDEADHAGSTLIMARALEAPPGAVTAPPGSDGEPLPGEQAEAPGMPAAGAAEHLAAAAGDEGPALGEDGAEAAADAADVPLGLEGEPDAEAEVAAVLATGTAAVTGAGPGTVLDWGPPPPFSARAPSGPGHAGRWFAASLVALLALGAQVIHYYRDALAASPAYGAAVRAAYARLGLPLDPDWPLDAYEIRGAKAIVEDSGPGALDIVAEIAVTGSQPVGLPMVRVVLRDRWSNTVASGVFSAAEYLAEPPPPASVYAPGTLIPVQINLKDPGAAAQGYELDVCMPNRQLGLQCKTARDPFRR